MSLFGSPKRKQAEQTAERLISGHLTLHAIWALSHAKVFEAMRQKPVMPLTYALQTKLSVEVLTALLEYLRQRGILSRSKEGFSLTPEGEALLDFELGPLEFVNAYQPVTSSLEHLLANLKKPGSGTAPRRDALAAAHAKRFSEELYPAILDILRQEKVSHLLDLNCGAGDLILHVAQAERSVVGVGIGGDGVLVRQANEKINAAGYDRRFLAVAANIIEVCLSPRKHLERIGVSQQLWERFEAVVLVDALTEVAAEDPERVTQALTNLARFFHKSRLILVEQSADARSASPCEAEIALLTRLSGLAPLTKDQWREHFKTAGYELLSSSGSLAGGMTIYTLKSTAKPAPVPPAAR